MKIYKTLRKRGLALFMSLIMCLSLIPTTAFAAEETDHVHNEDGWVCTWVDPVTETACIHTEHDSDCGYVEAAEEVPCDCGAVADDEGNVVHADGCAYKPAVEGQDCTHECGDECLKVVTEGYYICTAPEVEKIDEVPAEVQAFLDAVAELPAAEDVTPDNAVEISDQVNAVLDMYEALIDAGLDEREDVMEAKAAIDALQAAIKAALEGGSEDEVPAEVKAFLDAVAELPAVEDIDAYNAEAIGEQVNAVLDMYEALIDADLGEREDVTEALETVYAVYEAVLEAEEIDDSANYGNGYTGITKSGFADYYPNTNIYNTVTNGWAETGHGMVALTDSEPTATDYATTFYWGAHIGGWAEGYTSNLNCYSSDEDVVTATAVEGVDPVTGRPAIKVDFEKGSKIGIADVTVAYTVTRLSNDVNIAVGDQSAYSVSGYVRYSVSNGFTSVVSIEDADDIYYVDIDLATAKDGPWGTWSKSRQDGINLGYRKVIGTGAGIDCKYAAWGTSTGRYHYANQIDGISVTNSDSSVATITVPTVNPSDWWADHYATFYVEGLETGTTTITVDCDYEVSMPFTVTKHHKAVIYVNVTNSGSSSQKITLTYHDWNDSNVELTGVVGGYAGDTFTINSQMQNKPGYTFKGWAETKDSTTVKWEVGKDYVFNASDDLYAVWEKASEKTYTVTYTDGVEGKTVFADQGYEDLKEGDDTPEFEGGDPTSYTDDDGNTYTFQGWNPAVNPKVSADDADDDGNIVYTATWEKNAVTPTTYEVIYKDSLPYGFGDVTHHDRLEGTDTPAFSSSGNPTRKGYTFTGWKLTSVTPNKDGVQPKIAAVDANDKGEIIYTAQWKKDAPESRTKTVTIVKEFIGMNGNTIATDKVPADFALEYSYVYGGQTYTGTLAKNAATAGTNNLGHPSLTWTLDVLVDKDVNSTNKTQLTITEVNYEVDGYTWTKQSGLNSTDEKAVSGTYQINATSNLPTNYIRNYYTKNPDQYTVTYEWDGLPDNHGQTLPTGGKYAENAEVTVNKTYPQGREVTVGGVTYVFSGWSTKDATITNDKFTMPAKNVVIKGSWSVKANPGLSVTKTKTENGDTVTYTITVTNTGNVALYNTMLVDTMEKVLTPTDPTMASVSVTVANNDGNTKVTLLGVRDDVKAPQRNSAGYITWDEQGGLTRTTGGDDMWDFTWMLEGAFKVGATMTLSYSATINYPENADTVTYKNWADAIAGTSEDDVPKYDGGISTFSFVSGGSGAVGSGSGEVVGQQVKYTLTYDFDGGTWNGNSSYTVEQWSTIGSYTFKVDGTVQPTKDGCTFQNQWTKTGTTLTAGADVVATTENKHVTIKAVWTDNPVVTFNPNGGNWNNSTDPKKVPTDTDDKVTPPADPEQTNKVFDGWYTEQTGGTRVDFTTKTFGQDTTVYAHWEDDNWTDPKNDQNGGKPGDGISDKYQVKIVYAADENGKIADGAKTEEVFTLGTEGNYLTSGNVTISGSTAEANSRYYFKDWTSTRSVYTNLDKEDASLAGKELSVQGGTTYTFTANFEAKIELKIKNVGNGETVTYDGKEHTVTGYTMTVWDKDDKEITLPAGLIVTPASEDCVVKGTEARRSLYTMGLHVNDFQLTGPDAYKYYVSDWTVIDGWLKINPPETVLDVTASSVETTYDGQEHPIDPANIQVTVDGTPVNDATVTIAYVDENNQPITGAPKDAGTYTATITATKDGKSVSTTTTVTILKRNLTVTTDSASKTYDGTALTAPGRIGGLVDGETVTFTVTGSQTAAGNSVNIYTLIWNGTAKESNYDVTSVNRGTLTVNRRTLTVTTGSASKRYDGRPLTDSTITITGQAPGESITGVTTGSQTRVGSSYNTYTLTWGAGVLGSNYRIEENLGTLRVRDYTGGGAGGGTGGGGGTTTTPPTTTIPDTTTPLDPGTSIDDQDVPLAGTVGLNDTDHFAYIIGRDEDHVYPLSNITRAEVATIFFRLMTEDFRVANWSTTNSFTDVKEGDWYNNAISTCAKAGILKGREDGRFDPNASITRAEFAAIAARFLNDSYTDDGTGDFADTADHWAAKEIRLAAKAGWIYGSGNSFDPEARITRAEVMTIVNRMLDRTPDKDHMLPEMKKWADCPEDAWYYEAVQEATNEHDYTRDETSVETWTALKEGTDWAALELGWAANNGASAPAAETETETETQSLPDGI